MASPKYVRPQKHNSWFNVIPVRDFASLKSPRVPFLDSFVTLEATAEEPGYLVRYEVVHRMHVTVQYGFICVWFGDDLTKPAWPFPVLFDRSFWQHAVPKLTHAGPRLSIMVRDESRSL